MKQFFLNLLDSTSPFNSRVFAGLVLLALLVVMAIASFFTTIQTEVFYTVAGMCAACFGLSTGYFGAC